MLTLGLVCVVEVDDGMVRLLLEVLLASVVLVVGTALTSG